MAHQLGVNEVFGPTIQGEGPSCGRQAIFLRLAMCNLKCGYCDTPYTWDWKGENGKVYRKKDEVHIEDVEELWGKLDLMKQVPLLVITGGEPMLQQRALSHGLDWYGMPGSFSSVEIETNGTILPTEEFSTRPDVFFNVSPKLANSREKAINSKALYFFARHLRSRFKFVVQHSDQLDEVDSLVLRYGISHSSVWIMPEGRSAERLEMRLVELADAVISRGYNLSPRLHVVLWGDERGK